MDCSGCPFLVHHYPLTTPATADQISSLQRKLLIKSIRLRTGLVRVQGVQDAASSHSVDNPNCRVSPTIVNFGPLPQPRPSTSGDLVQLAPSIDSCETLEV